MPRSLPRIRSPYNNCMMKPPVMSSKYGIPATHPKTLQYIRIDAK